MKNVNDVSTIELRFEREARRTTRADKAHRERRKFLRSTKGAYVGEHGGQQK